ncbi:MAG: hypothetical protein WBL82_06675, partial [Terriglobales bacterium]
MLAPGANVLSAPKRPLTTVTVLADNEKAKVIQPHLIPREATVADLERKTADAEEKAAKEPEPRAAELREEAKLCREWA